MPNKSWATDTKFFLKVFNETGGNWSVDILLNFERNALNAIQNPRQDREKRMLLPSLHLWKISINSACRINTVQMTNLLYLSKCFVQLLSYRQKRLYVVSKLYVTSFKATLKIKRTTCWITSKIRTLVHSDIMLLKSNPLSSISLWNMFNRMDQEFSRTKSRIEGWHRSFQGHLSSCHPNFWKFSGVLKTEETFVGPSVPQHQNGPSGPAPIRRYTDSNAQILRILDDYSKRDIKAYLCSIAVNVAF